MLLAMIGAMALAAAPAHAEEPFWKVAGSRLGSGAKKEFAMSSSGLVIKGESGGNPFTVTCSSASTESANLLGSPPGETGTDEHVTAARGCHSFYAGRKCIVTEEKITFHKVKSTLVTMLDGLGQQLIDEKNGPDETTTVVKISMSGEECPIEIVVKGSYAVTLAVSGSPIMVGKELEASVLEAVVSPEPITVVMVGKEKQEVGLTVEGKPATMEGTFAMELAGGAKFGPFTK